MGSQSPRSASAVLVELEHRLRSLSQPADQHRDPVLRRNPETPRRIRSRGVTARGIGTLRADRNAWGRPGERGRERHPCTLIQQGAPCANELRRAYVSAWPHAEHLTALVELALPQRGQSTAPPPRLTSRTAMRNPTSRPPAIPETTPKRIRGSPKPHRPSLGSPAAMARTIAKPIAAPRSAHIAAVSHGCRYAHCSLADPVSLTAHEAGEPS